MYYDHNHLNDYDRQYLTGQILVILIACHKNQNCWWVYFSQFKWAHLTIFTDQQLCHWLKICFCYVVYMCVEHCRTWGPWFLVKWSLESLPREIH